MQQQVHGAAIRFHVHTGAPLLLVDQPEDVGHEILEKGFERLDVGFGGAGGSVVNLIDERHGLEQMGDDDGGVEVVVERFPACVGDAGDLVGHVAGFRGFQSVEAALSLHEFLQSFLRRLKRLVGEIDRGAVVRHEDKQADGHGGIGLLQLGMRAGEEFVEGDEVAQRLTHLLPVDGDHVVVHPVVHGILSIARHGLRYLAFVVGEFEVDATAVDVEFLP